MKTSELSGVALRWAVAEAEGLKSMVPTPSAVVVLYPNAVRFVPFRPDVDWGHGGPIIEREGIAIYKGNPVYFPQGNESGDYYEPLWLAGRYGGRHHGTTPLVAAMRCFVASKLGDTVEVPDELMEAYNETA